jgi:hypothetical protein
MPKRLLFALGILALILAACKSAGTSTTPTPTPSPTPQPTASTAPVTAYYNGSPYYPPNGSGTIYANVATGSTTKTNTDCQGSTTVTGSTLSAQTGAIPSGGSTPQPDYQATFSNLTPTAYYIFFYVASSSGPIVSVCTDLWSYGVTLKYP